MKEARKKDLPMVKMSQTLLTTRRLLYWSYQIGKRQTRSIYTIFIKKEEQITRPLEEKERLPSRTCENFYDFDKIPLDTIDRFC
jgi:hypothetical protein